MQIQIIKKKVDTETIELEVPAYFKTDYSLHKITEESVISVSKRLCLVTKKTDFLGMDKELQEAITGEKIDAGQFQDALNVFFYNLNS